MHAHTQPSRSQFGKENLDRAVQVSHQRQGIGRELIRRMREAGGQATIILLAAPKAVDEYPRIGFTHHPQAWWFPHVSELR